MQNKQNQTNPEWLESPQVHDRGTGIFLIPDVYSKEARAVKKEFVQNITYEECLRRGSLALVFKWVPQSIARYEALTSYRTVCGQPCIETCVTPGCECFDGICR